MRRACRPRIPGVRAPGWRQPLVGCILGTPHVLRKHAAVGGSSSRLGAFGLGAPGQRRELQHKWLQYFAEVKGWQAQAGQHSRELKRSLQQGHGRSPAMVSCSNVQTLEREGVRLPSERRRSLSSLRISAAEQHPFIMICTSQQQVACLQRPWQRAVCLACTVTTPA